MSEDERLREIAWKRNRRGYRWNLLRCVVAICSLKWMTTAEVQDVMMSLHGTTHGKTLQLLGELERPKFVAQERDETDQIYKWGATPRGARSWLPTGTPICIPVRIVQAVETINAV